MSLEPGWYVEFSNGTVMKCDSDVYESSTFVEFVLDDVVYRLYFTRSFSRPYAHNVFYAMLPTMQPKTRISTFYDNQTKFDEDDWIWYPVGYINKVMLVPCKQYSQF